MSVEVSGRVAGSKISLGRVKATARRILKIVGRRRAELSLAFVDNREMRKLNARYRKKDRPTDVLSFPAGGIIPGGIEILGDVVISLEKAEEQARKRGKTLEQEVGTLLIHGILHLLGYDHERSAKEAKIMGAMERRVARALCGAKNLKV